MSRQARRGSFEQYGDILTTVNEEVSANGEALPTNISTRAGLTYTRFKELLTVLRDKGLVSLVESEGHSRIELTESGWSYLREYEHVKRFLIAFGLG
jgi:predicted transcriptional regulator